jgi:hypothetical protein
VLALLFGHQNCLSHSAFTFDATLETGGPG